MKPCNKIHWLFTGYADKAKSDDGHIMISYQWSDQEMVIKIRDSLEDAGFKVKQNINNLFFSHTLKLFTQLNRI